MSIENYSQPETLLIIFAREPVQGQVKTRLIPVLGRAGATELYRRLLDYTVVKMTTAALSPVQLCITPDSHAFYFDCITGAGQFDVSAQQGRDLGARMYNALVSGLKQYAKVILIGTDCPFIDIDELQLAIKMLDDNDMVFSPAFDGGYVLVGAKKVEQSIFNRIDWGSDKVMEQSRKAMSAHGIDWYELPKQNDIDVKEDLKCLLLHNDFKDFILNKT